MFSFYDQKIVKYDANGEIIVNTEVVNKDIPYADAFTVNCCYIISKIDDQSCNMSIFAAINFVHKPNFIAKCGLDYFFFN